MLFDEEWVRRRLLMPAAAYPAGESPERHATGLAELVEALTVVPPELSAALAEAAVRCPEVLELESDPQRFLRCENFSGYAAVLRLAQYWTARKRAFGERAFGLLAAALDRDDAECLISGYQAVLPRDLCGRPVVLLDESAKSETWSRRTLERAAFSVCQLLSEYMSAQTEGVVVLVPVPASSSSRGPSAAALEPLEVALQAVPVRIRAVYVVSVLPRGAAATPPSLPALDGLGPLLRTRAVPLAGDSPDAAMFQLERHGLSRPGVPSQLGGTWNVRQQQAQPWADPGPAPAAHVSEGGSGDVADSSEESRTRQLHARHYETSDLQGAAALVELFHTENSPRAAFGTRYDRALLLDQFHDALALIPDAEKEAYAQAKATAPRVFKRESDPMLFLRCERFDPWAAAKRITKYWAKRKELLGDRAFLPLNLSGRGALSDDDILAFKSCFVVQLPDSADGLSVICFNKELSPRGLPPEAKWRALFYLSHVCSQNAATVHKGVISLHIMTQLASPTTPSVVAGGLDLMQHALPIRVHTCHFICIRPRSNVAAYFANWFRTIQHFLRQSFLGRVQVHVCETGLDVLAKLEPFGILASGIPESIGGSWSYANGLRWVQQRQVAEAPATSEEPVKPSSAKSARLPRASDGEWPGSKEEEEAPRSKPKRARVSQELSLTDDVYPDGFVESESVTCKGLEQMEQAIADLPEEDKADLLLARREVPDLVEKESPMLRFLRFEKYNSWAAARRLATYWKNRKRVFGSRCFLPMNQTGEGTLTRDDLASLSTGYVAFLKNDSRGRSVLLYDSSRRVNHSPETRLRCSFYMWGILAENEVSQDEGYVSLSVLSRPTLDRTLKECIDLVEQSIPARNCEAHIVNCPSVTEKSSFLSTMVPLLLQLMGPFLQKNTQVHVADSRAKLAEILVSCGFEKEGLPKCVGGSWGYEMFSQWQESRLRYEWELPPSGVNEEQAHIPEYKLKPISDMTEEEKTERKRRMNVLHSRRRRERQRVEMEVFAEQAADLREKNWLLQQENSKLEVMLRDATTKVSRLDPYSGLRSVTSAASSHAQELARMQPTRQTARGLGLGRMPSPIQPVGPASHVTRANMSAASSLEHFSLPQHFLERELANKARQNANVRGGVTLQSALENSIIEQHILSEQQRQRILAAQLLQSSNMPPVVPSSVRDPLELAQEAELARQVLDARGMVPPEEPQGFIASLLGLPWWFNS